MNYDKATARDLTDEIRHREKRKLERLSKEVDSLEKQRKYAIDRESVDGEIAQRLERLDKTSKHFVRSETDRRRHHHEILNRKTDWKKEVEYNEKHKQPIDDWMYRKANDGIKE